MSDGRIENSTTREVVQPPQQQLTTQERTIDATENENAETVVNRRPGELNLFSS